MKKTSYIKLIAVMIAMIMAFSVVSCSNAGETSTTESTTTKEDTTVETSDRLQDTESSEATEVQSEENTVEQTESKDADDDISIETTSEKATEEQSTETSTEEDTVGIATEEQSTETATEEDTMGITTEEQTTKKPEVDYEETTEKANGGSENQTEQKEEPVVEYSPLNDPTNIITLNKDMEPLVIQGASGRSNYFKDKYVPLQFVHVADMHADLDNWNRMVEYVNYYSDYISFVMHAGDYVGGNQGVFVNMYKDGLYCDVPIL